MMVEVREGERENERKPLQPLSTLSLNNGTGLMRVKEPEIKLAPRAPFEEYNIVMKT